MPSSQHDAGIPEFKRILQDKNVERWYKNLWKGSPIVANCYLRDLHHFCKDNNVTPRGYASLPRPKMENMAMDYINDFEAKISPKTGRKYSPGYVGRYLKAIKSWAEWNGKKFQRKIKISNPNKRPTLEDEVVPTPKRFHDVVYAPTTSLRTRVSIAIEALAGPRPEVQGDYLGLEGLRIKDLPELEISGNTVTFKKIPTMIIVREEISKSRRQYFTFLPQEGCELLKSYLEQRLRSGEVLGPASPLISCSEQDRLQLVAAMENKGCSDTSPILRTQSITKCIREAMKAVGLKQRPYVWRSYFDTNLMLAESRGLCSHAYQQFWMGHVGDIEATYTTNKKRLPEEVVEDMRVKFQRIAKELTQSPAFKASSAQEIRKDAAKDQIRLLETFNLIPKEKINDLYAVIEQSPQVGIGEIDWHEILNQAGIPIARVSQELTPDQVKKFVEEKERKEPRIVANAQQVVMSAAKTERKRIKNSELDEYLSKGYKPIFNLTNDEMVVELAN